MLILRNEVQEALNRAFSRNWKRVGESTFFVVHRAWILEIVFLLVATTFFALLWWHSGITSTPIGQYIQSIWAILPVLAVTNALPMLGVGAFLARYSVPDKPSESLAAISSLVQEDYDRIYGHPRTNPFSRTAAYYNVLKST